MSEIIERAAKALDEVEIIGTLEWQTTEARMENRRRQVRAVIAAMREPTEEMVREGWPYTADPCWQEDVARCWTAMVDAALGKPNV